MKFFKEMIVRKKGEETAEEQSGLSIEDLQRDLDRSGMEQSLRDPDSAWSEKAAQRPGDARTGDPDEAEDGPDPRTVSRDLEWDDELGDTDDTKLREAFDAPRARRQTRPVVDEDYGEDDGFDEFGDEFEDEFDELEPEEEKAIKDNALLVEEIRDAIAAVRHIESEDRPAERPAPDAPAASRKGSWEQDDVFGRKALARDQLKGLAEGDDSERILEETNHKMDDDDEANRRRLAMAHLKAAAAATKADSVLKRVVGRDPATDLEQQVQYREDLANVVRQRGPRSEAISRPLSRPLSRPVSRPYSQSVQPEEAKSEPTGANVEPLRPEYSEPVAEETGIEPTPEFESEAVALPDNNEPAEATMDVEKLDLKTALERQKAILKAEREALEAEIAAEQQSMAETAEQDADDAFKSAEMAAQEPEMEPDADADFDEDTVEDDDADAFGDVEEEPVDVAAEEFEPAPAPKSEEPAASAADEDDDADDDWDEGLEDEGDAPVDLTMLEEPAPAPEETVAEATEAVRELDLSDNDEDPQPSAPAEAAVAAAPRRAGRVKTRLLGFQSKTPGQDVFEGKAAAGAGPVRFPVGWLVITKGEGFGHSFSLLSGVSKIGRGDDQAVKLDFGDTAISRDNHAAVAFDEELNQFFLGHGGKSNVVRLNGKPVLSTEELFDGDEIRIGETTLKFIALCGEEFTWAETEGNGSEHAASA